MIAASVLVAALEVVEEISLQVQSNYFKKKISFSSFWSEGAEGAILGRAKTASKFKYEI